MIVFESKNERLLLQAILKFSENEDFRYELSSERHDFTRTYKLRVLGYGREFNVSASSSTSSFTFDCGEVRNIVGIENVKDPVDYLAKTIRSTIQENCNHTKEAMKILLGEEV